MSLYGDIATVETMLRGTPSVDLGADFAARFPGIQASVSAALEEKIGRSFGPVAGVAQGRLIYAGPYQTLLLDTPLRSLTSIQRYGYWDGSAYQTGLTLGPTEWVADPVDRDGNILGIRLASGAGWGYLDRSGRPTTPVYITGIWGDQPAEASAAIPADLTDIANFLIMRTYQIRVAGPAGVSAADGSIVRAADPWKDQLVTAVIEKYRVHQMIAF